MSPVSESNLWPVPPRDEGRGVAGYDAAALLKVPADRRTGRWTESGETVSVAWTLRDPEKFRREGENLKSGGTLWGRL